MSVLTRVPIWLRFIVLAGLLAAVAGIVYLRYFYGDDAPPPLELSPAALLVFRRPRGGSAARRSVKRVWATPVLAAITVAVVALPATGATPVKAKVGAKCTKAGTTGVSGSTALVCTKVGKSLVWRARPTTPATSAATGAAATGSSATTVAAKAAATPTPSAGPEGTWKAITGSVAGYRVRELFVGGIAKVDAAGRSEAVTASVVLARAGGGLVARNLTASVDMTQLKSDESRRDDRMRTTGLETNKFGTATFVGADVTLPADAESGSAIKVTLVGKMTLHGVTRDVEIPADARLADGTLEVVGRLPIKMADWNIEPPEIADFVKADDDGSMEFKLVMKKA